MACISFEVLFEDLSIKCEVEFIRYIVRDQTFPEECQTAFTRELLMRIKTSFVNITLDKIDDFSFTVVITTSATVNVTTDRIPAEAKDNDMLFGLLSGFGSFAGIIMFCCCWWCCCCRDSKDELVGDILLFKKIDES
ncbi:Hypothetical predicted protein [Octopus vulgaris]|uniref:Uncharacterized protein n=1 Tax=Octopus vulgaris TaxID=6645 RepID=A0AA36B4R5_OCTVU|nr:Hypothetical predicted protein [Octopus vulgaris]